MKSYIEIKIEESYRTVLHTLNSELHFCEIKVPYSYTLKYRIIVRTGISQK